VLLARERRACRAAAQMHEETRSLVPGQLAVELERDRTFRLGAGERGVPRLDETERHIR
jgi:hypothetical protein